MARSFPVAADLRAALDRRPRLVAAGIIGASLLVIAGVGHVSAVRSPRLGVMAAGAAAAALGAAALLRQPAWGPILLVAAGLLAPFQVGTGTKSGINIALLLAAGLAGLWFLDVLVRPERRGWVRSRAVPPVLALGAVAVVAFIVGQLGWFDRAGAPMRSQLGGLALYLLSIAAFLVVAVRVPDERWLARLTWVFLGVGAVMMIDQLAPSLPLPKAWKDVRSSVFLTWLAALAFGQAIYNTHLRVAWRLLLGVLAASVFYVGLVRAPGWTAGWLPPLIAMLVTLWAGKPRWAAVATLAGVAVVLLNWPRVEALLLTGGGEYGQAWSIYTRGETWRAALGLVKFSPVIGFGPANYFFYTPLVRLVRWNVEFTTHNQYLDLLLQTGILGLGCFLWFAAAAGRLAWRLRSSVPRGFERAYVLGALGGLAGTLAAGVLVDYVIPMVYNQGLKGYRSSMVAWLFLGGLVVLERVTGPDRHKGSE